MKLNHLKKVRKTKTQNWIFCLGCGNIYTKEKQFIFARNVFIAKTIIMFLVKCHVKKI